jgi:hypothetical protein
MWSLSTFALYILVKIICTIHLWEKWDFLFIDSDLLYRGTFKTGLTTYLIPLPKIILLKRNKYISNSINWVIIVLRRILFCTTLKLYLYNQYSSRNNIHQNLGVI